MSRSIFDDPTLYPNPSPFPHCLSIEFRTSGLSYLQLVLAGLSLRRGVEEVDSENLFTMEVSV